MRSRPAARVAAVTVAGVLLLGACATASDDVTVSSSAGEVAGDTGADGDTARSTFRYPSPPSAPSATDPSPTAARNAVERIRQRLDSDAQLDIDAVGDLAESGDARNAWFVSDLMRFFGEGEGDALTDAFEQLTATSLADDPDSERNVWLSATNHLIAWDMPDYPGYRVDKSGIFLPIEAGWEPFFGDADSDIDWRHLSWGGVLIDDRDLGETGPCDRGCIPSLDDPATTDASGGDWYPNDAIVFGIVEGDEALAIPKNIAEIHEMFNLTLDGRRFGIAYCTLCGSAQAYRTDTAVDQGAADEPVLRTSGLLSRSNKVMYDLRTDSVFDTFTGAAVSGPLQDVGVVLEETTVVRTTWGEWKAQHPDTRLIAEDGGIGRSYPLDPLQGRDDDGPIFPIGAADDRLGVQELVVGVITGDGTPVAFPADASRDALDAGRDVVQAGVELVGEGGGLRALDAATGEPLVAHESFWFAWSQFHPTTELWTP